MKTILRKISEIFGFRRNSHYVKDYLDNANMRSGIYMSAVIFILEAWLIIRQTDKYIIPALKQGNPFFKTVFTNTSTFWLLMSLGATMLFYCIQSTLKAKKKYIYILTFVCAAISTVFVCFLPLEFEWSLKFTPLSKAIYAGLKIGFYGIVLLFNIAIIGASIYQIKGGKSRILNSMMVITIFALACLVFGTMVSFGDFSSTAKFDNGEFQHKQIICFLMMSIYIGCLLIWKPYISVGILGTIFLGFYLLIDGLSSWSSGGRQVPEGDQVNYITFFISLTMICISIYDQRVNEAKKDEELEILATKDTLTNLYSFEYFITLTGRKIESEKLKTQEWIYLFMDITSFKIFNDQKGFEKGNIFLCETADILTKYFPDSYITRQSDDHFVIFTQNKYILEKIQIVNKEIEKEDLDIRPGIKVGGYIFRDAAEDIHESVEKARYACAFLKHSVSGHYLEYDTEMHDNYRMVQYIVRHIDEAVEKGWIEAYYQPVVWSKDRTLCSMEILSRWNDPKYGFIMPNKFVGALEDSQLAYKLDLAVLELACKNIKHCILNNLPVIPVSINFSRMDFMLPGLVDSIEKVVDRYKVKHDLIHVEITESALLGNGDILKEPMRRLHEKGFSIWLDDFGSGYSSLNALKEYEFDVLKLDMRFLVGFTNNSKAKALIQSVTSMAEQIGMSTVCEGVEREEHAEFLKSVNCHRLQGYLIGKPIPFDQVMERIRKKDLILSKEIKKGM